MTDKNEKALFEAPIKPVDKNLEENKDLLEGLSWAGKLFFAGAAAFILGSGMQQLRLPIKVRGRPEEIKAVIDAITSSKRFQQEISRPGATIDSVIEKLQLRNLTKQNFKNIVGREWPL